MPRIEVKDGVPSNRWYVIEYDEDQWYRYDDAGKQFCYDTWIKKATPLPDIDMVVLRLIPDPVFPRGDKELPYIEWQHCIDRREQPVRDGRSLRHDVEALLQRLPADATYETMCTALKNLLAGKVNK